MEKPMADHGLLREGLPGVKPACKYYLEVGSPKGEEISLDLVGRLQDNSLASSPGSGGRVRFFFRPPSGLSQAQSPASAKAKADKQRSFIGK